MIVGRLSHAFWLIAAATAAGCSEPAPTSGSAAPPRTTPAPQTAAPAPSRDTFVVAPDLPPLSAAAVSSGPRSVETIRSVYEFAARHPEVLKYVPCFCGCERAGHQHNADCFVAGRTPAGAVTSWDYHGVG